MKNIEIYNQIHRQKSYIQISKTDFNGSVNMSSKAKSSAQMLMKELQQINKSGNENFSVGVIDEGNIYKWEVILIGPVDTFYEGGYFKCQMDFPEEYPHKPPKLKFISKMYHPNVYKTGKVCISILHEGVDETGYEQANERWSPALGVEGVLLSVLSMLSDPNDESPANVEAAKMWREDKDRFKKEVGKIVRRSIEEL